MMESGISASKKHAKLKLAPQLDTSLQSFWPTTHQHTPEHYGMSSNIKCVMIFSDGSDPLNQNSDDDEVLDYGLYLIQHHLAREGIGLYTIAPDMPQIVGDWHAVQHTNNIFIQR